EAECGGGDRGEDRDEGVCRGPVRPVLRPELDRLERRGAEGRKPPAEAHPEDAGHLRRDTALLPKGHADDDAEHERADDVDGHGPEGEGSLRGAVSDDSVEDEPRSRTDPTGEGDKEGDHGPGSGTGSLARERARRNPSAAAAMPSTVVRAAYPTASGRPRRTVSTAKVL